MEIKVYATLEPEQLWEAGKNAGLSNNAAEYFRHFEEVPLILTVDSDTGVVYDCSVEPDFIKNRGH